MKTRGPTLAAAALGLLLQFGCTTHLAGIVIDPSTNRPVPTAVFTDGSPDSRISVVKYPAAPDGRFDFKFPTIDKSWIFIWNGQGGPAMVYRKIDPTEFGTNMIVHFTPNQQTSVSNQFQYPLNGRPPLPAPTGQ
jgi:hypothetical protein